MQQDSLAGALGRLIQIQMSVRMLNGEYPIGSEPVLEGSSPPPDLSSATCSLSHLCPLYAAPLHITQHAHFTPDIHDLQAPCSQ